MTDEFIREVNEDLKQENRKVWKVLALHYKCFLGIVFSTTGYVTGIIFKKGSS